MNKAFEIGDDILQKQDYLSTQHKYTKLPENLSYMVRTEYAKVLPDFFMFDNNQSHNLHSRDGVLLAKGWSRVVIGDYGAFVEIPDDLICKENIIVKPGEEYRIHDPKYSQHVKYHWYIPKTGYASKLYFQQGEVTYADYKAGMWYISPHETKEGGYISNHEPVYVSPKVEKTVAYSIQEALKEPSKQITIPSGVVVFDTETTGFSRSDELLQISIYNINEEALLDTYVKPFHKIRWDSAMEIHHITPQMVQSSPLPHQIVPMVRDIFNSAEVVIGHNVSFDARMVEQCLGVTIPKSKLYDTMTEFKKTGYGSYKLKDAVAYYCPEKLSSYQAGAHNSKVDTLLTLAVYKQQCAERTAEQEQDREY